MIVQFPIPDVHPHLLPNDLLTSIGNTGHGILVPDPALV